MAALDTAGKPRPCAEPEEPSLTLRISGFDIPTRSVSEDLYRPAAKSSGPPTRSARVSLTMIVKNEEENLPRCLASVEGIFDEIIIVDTGSTDRTKEIAREFGAKVFDFEWIDTESQRGGLGTDRLDRVQVVCVDRANPPDDGRFPGRSGNRLLRFSTKLLARATRSDSSRTAADNPYRDVTNRK
jgi:cellulose synthase/poly-beta-1,6-N-acetylglucosamine synthase-like glycosyltransferase